MQEAEFLRTTDSDSQAMVCEERGQSVPEGGEPERAFRGHWTRSASSVKLVHQCQETSLAATQEKAQEQR